MTTSAIIRCETFVPSSEEDSPTEKIDIGNSVFPRYITIHQLIDFIVNGKEVHYELLNVVLLCLPSLSDGKDFLEELVSYFSAASSFPVGPVKDAKMHKALYILRLWISSPAGMADLSNEYLLETIKVFLRGAMEGCNAVCLAELRRIKLTLERVTAKISSIRKRLQTSSQDSSETAAAAAMTHTRTRPSPVVSSTSTTYFLSSERDDPNTPVPSSFTSTAASASFSCATSDCSSVNGGGHTSQPDKLPNQHLDVKVDGRVFVHAGPLVSVPIGSDPSIHPGGTTTATKGGGGCGGHTSRPKGTTELRLTLAAEYWQELREKAVKKLNASTDEDDAERKVETTATNHTMIVNVLRNFSNTNISDVIGFINESSRCGSSIVQHVEFYKLAEVLTALELREMAAIRPRELVKMGWANPDRKHVHPDIGGANRLFRALSGANQRIAWIAREVVRYGATVGPTSQCIEYFVRVAKTCRTMNNFSTLFQVVAALGLPAVKHLRVAWAAVSPDKMSEIKKLTELCAETNDFRLYRSTLAAEAKERHPRIPCLQVVLRDLTFLDGARVYKDSRMDLRQAVVTYDIVSDFLNSHAGCGPIARHISSSTDTKPTSPRRGTSHELLSGLWTHSVESSRTMQPHQPHQQSMPNVKLPLNQAETGRTSYWPGQGQRSGYVVEFAGGGAEAHSRDRAVTMNPSAGKIKSAEVTEQNVSRMFRSVGSREEPQRTPLAMSIFESPGIDNASHVTNTHTEAKTAVVETAPTKPTHVSVSAPATVPASFESLKSVVTAAISGISAWPKRPLPSKQSPPLSNVLLDVAMNPIANCADKSDAGIDEDEDEVGCFPLSSGTHRGTHGRIQPSSSSPGLSRDASIDFSYSVDSASSGSTGLSTGQGILRRDSSSSKLAGWSASTAIESAVTWSAGMGRKADLFCMKIDQAVFVEVEQAYQSTNIDLLKLWDEAKITNEVEAGRLLSELALTGLL